MSFIDKIRDRLFGFNQPVSMDDVPKIIKNRPSKQENLQPKQENLQPKPHVEDHMNEVDKSQPSHILFVCSGNICRSAYAAAKLKQLSQGRSIKIASAGTLRLVGRKAAPKMIESARENGVDLEDHRSSALSKLLIDSADIIFAMEPMHSARIAEISPDASKRVLLLGLFLNEPTDTIEDPMGQAPEVYQSVAALIDEALTNWFKRTYLQPQTD
ncbi:MAG: hypothetical protein J6A01_10575 [Proteobacteria bacterium]|nr:hypothetical protein [Pseudomonadota bacterium]